jgi:non-ribosomal peptide synthetase component E (peptide arylation enzyme)
MEAEMTTGHDTRPGSARRPPVPSLRRPGERERYRAEGLYGDDLLVDLFDRQVVHDPRHAAVFDGERRLDYGGLQQLTLRLAALLIELGVGPGDPVAAQLPNHVLLPALHLACNRIGALFHPLSSSWRRKEVELLLGVTDPPVLISVPSDRDVDLVAFHDVILPSLGRLKRLIYTNDRPGSLDELLAGTTPLDEDRRSAMPQIRTRRV